MWIRAAAILLCSGLLGCTRTFYEPAICVDEVVDTLVVVNNAQYVTYHECGVWRALSDSTKCWTNTGERLPCPIACTWRWVRNSLPGTGIDSLEICIGGSW